MCVPDALEYLLEREAEEPQPDCPTKDYIVPTLLLHRSVYEKLGEKVVDAEDDAVNVDNIRTYANRVAVWYDGWELLSDYLNQVVSDQDDDQDDVKVGDLYSEYTYLQAIFWQMLQVGRELDEEIVNILALPDDNDSMQELLALELEARAPEANALDADVVEALFPADASVPAPIQGLPLLSLLGGALSPIYDRLNNLVEFHDYGCALAQCDAQRRTTPVTDFWNMLAHLDNGVAMGDGVTLAAAVNASPYSHNGWTEVLSKIALRPELITEALSEGQGSVPYDSGSLTLSKTRWEMPAVRFVEILFGAVERNKSYQATGYFSGKNGKYLKTRTHYAKRGDVTAVVDGWLGELKTANTDYTENIVDTVNTYIQTGNANANLEGAKARQETVRNELLDLMQRRDGHIGAGALASDVHAEIAAELAALDGVIDETRYVTVERITQDNESPLEFAGSDAKYTGGETQITQVAAYGPIPVEAHEFLSLYVNPSSTWSPICSISEVQTLTPDEKIKGIELGEAEIGPEGFNVTWSGSAYEASGNNHSDGWEFTAGVKAEVCKADGPIEEAFGLSYSVCAYADEHYTDSSMDFENHGDESRVSAAFSGGLHLRSTPFPAAPVGSLLVVEMPRGSVDPMRMRDVHLVRSGSTAVQVEGQSDLYLVVNDKACSGAMDTPVLQVEIAKMTSSTSSAVAENMMERMRYVLMKVRHEKAGLEEREEILSTELSAIRSNAIVDLMQDEDFDDDGEMDYTFSGPQLPLTSYPESLKALFTALLDKELLRLERAVRLVNLAREIEIKRTELYAADMDVAAAKANAALIGFLPSWHMRNLYGSYVRYLSQRLVRIVHEYFLPIFRLWYGEDGEDLSWLEDVDVTFESSGQQANFGDVMNALLGVEIDEPLNVQVDRLAALTTAALTEYWSAAKLQEDKADSGDVPRDPVVLSLGLNPYFDQDPINPPEPAPPPEFLRSTLKGISDAAAQSVWDALKYGGTAHIQLEPEDIYQTGQSQAQLACARSLPVLRHAVLVGRMSVPVDPGFPMSFNDCRTGVRQVYVTDKGPEEYTLISDELMEFNIPQLFVEDNNFLQWPIDSVVSDTTILGYSPFALITLYADPAYWLQWNYYQVEEMFLALEVESMQDSSDNLQWIATCRDP